VAYSTVEKSVIVYEKNQPIFFEKSINSFWDWFNIKQVTIQSAVQALGDEDTDEPTQAGRATLQVGFIGHFGYEMKRESLPGYQWTQSQAQEGCETTDAQFMFAQEVLRFDHVSRKWKLFSLVRGGDADPIADMFRPTQIGRTADEHDQFTNKLRADFAALQQPCTAPIAMPKFSSQYSQKGYASLIGQARAAIKEGDSYEMTLTTKFRAHSNHNEYFGLYRTLRAKNPAPYSAYLNFPATDTTILSSSPERFISIDRRGFAEMKPIKGTVGVSKDPIEDAMIKQKLAADVKELAENLMVRPYLWLGYT
jgi:para-aminobenzoate synthetase